MYTNLKGFIELTPQEHEIDMVLVNYNTILYFAVLNG